MRQLPVNIHHFFMAKTLFILQRPGLSTIFEASIA